MMSIVNWLFEKAEPLLVAACEKLESVAKSRRHYYSNFDPYLTRLYFTKRPSRGVGIYLHYHHRGDPDLAMHNHPFGWICTVVLTNGYVEERWDSSSRSFASRIVRPGSISLVRVDDFHRLKLIDKRKGAWTLFISGRRVSDVWGFWWPNGFNQFVPHINFARSRIRYARPD